MARTKAKNGAKKAISMSAQNAGAIKDLRMALDKHASDEEVVWGGVQKQVQEIHAFLIGDVGSPDKPGMAERQRATETQVVALTKDVDTVSGRMDAALRESRWTGGLSGVASVVAAAIVAAFVGPRQ